MPLRYSPYLNFALADLDDGVDVNFASWRTALAGSQTTSNFMILDEKVSIVDAKILALQKQSILPYISFTAESLNTYSAIVIGLLEYVENMTFTFSVDVENTDASTINISNLGAIYIMRYDNLGELINIRNSELKENERYFIQYDGTYFILLSTVSIDSLHMHGVIGNLTEIKENGVLSDSGKKISDFESTIIGNDDADTYWNGAKKFEKLFPKVRGTDLTGLDLTDELDVINTDTILQGIGKLQAQSSLKANQATTYTKDEIDDIIVVPQYDDTEIKDNIIELETNLALKADKLTTYTKDEVDDKIDNIPLFDDKAIKASINLKADKSIIYNIIALATGWNGNIQTLEVKGLKTTSEGSIGTTDDAPFEETVKAQLRYMMPIDDSINIIADGDIPTVDIPIKIREVF